MQLTYSDVNLGYFEYRQNQINRLNSGDNLIIGNDGCTNIYGDMVLKFSKKFNETITQLKGHGYHLKNARINFILFWKDPDKDHEFKIILPELDLEKISGK